MSLSNRIAGDSAPVTAQDIAVVIVNYNGGEYLIACLRALLALTQQPGEIIVVDNDSSDDSRAAVIRQFESVRLIDAGSNTGFAAANNIGIAATQKTWVALVNPDAYVDQNWLQALLDALKAHPEVGFFSAELIDAKDHSKLDGQGDCYHVSGLVWRRKHGQPVNGEASRFPIFAPCAASALYSRAAILQAGGFDEDYFCYNEDIDMGFRLRLAGHHCLHVSEAITYHEGSAITERESDFSIYYGHRNLVWTYFKNMPTTLLWLYMPQHLLMNFISIAYYVAKGRPGVIFKAKWDALKGLPAVIRKRNRQPVHTDVKQAMARGWLSPYLHRHD